MFIGFDLTNIRGDFLNEYDPKLINSFGNKVFKTMVKKVPRLRGFTKHFYFAHPFLDAWFAWFPLNQIEYGGAAEGKKCTGYS